MFGGYYVIGWGVLVAFQFWLRHGQVVSKIVCCVCSETTKTMMQIPLELLPLM